MVTDKQARRLMSMIQSEKTKAVAAAKAGMDEKTARKYRRAGKMPSEMKAEHTWRTRGDAFCTVWGDMRAKLDLNSGLEAKTLFEDLQRRVPGQFADGQLRTLQRRVKLWRATEGPGREVYFAQVHHPGELCQSDFTDMNGLGITIGGAAFNHKVYHFVLTYSNWEDGTICFSESFESLSEGLQNSLWKLGGVPKEHRTDQLTAAVQKPDQPEKFTQRYSALLRHYELEGCKTQAAHPNENGDVEQRHHRFKRAVDQALMLRGSRDFGDRPEYGEFLRKLMEQLNAGRKGRLAEEMKVLRRLPDRRLDACKRIMARVGQGSTVRGGHNVYSVNSRLIGEQVELRLYAEQVEVWYGQRRVDAMPRLRGDGNHHIQYRHVIDWLERKPGAFENYRYREEMFPTSRFRIAYDDLKRSQPAGHVKEYLQILRLAAQESETAVDDALRQLIASDRHIRFEAVETIVRSGQKPPAATDVMIDAVDNSAYDALLSEKESLYVGAR